jgi:hypothetical protein
VIDAQWPNASLLWASTGDQWIQHHLVKEYGTPAAKKRMNKVMRKVYAGEDLDDDELDDTIAEGGEDRKLNADIEAWLLKMHAKHPILFAARREDGEAGGTRLGAWHKKSVAMFQERVVPELAKLASKIKKEDDLRRTPIQIGLEYLGDKAKVPAAVKALGEGDD